MAPKRDYEREKREKRHEARTLGDRIRKARLTAGLTRAQVVQHCSFSEPTFVTYELGSQMPRSARVGEIAHSIGCPVAALFTDEVVLAELRVSPETLERVRSEGQSAAEDVAERMASSLVPLLLAEATRPPVDVRPHARPKRRRSRAEMLAGVAKANAARAARARADSREIR